MTSPQYVHVDASAERRDGTHEVARCLLAHGLYTCTVLVSCDIRPSARAQEL